MDISGGPDIFVKDRSSLEPLQLEVILETIGQGKSYFKSYMLLPAYPKADVKLREWQLVEDAPSELVVEMRWN